jgi:hypothetical protein
MQLAGAFEHLPGGEQLAATAYGTFGPLFAKSGNEEIRGMGESFAGTMRRLSLPGHPMEISGTLLSGKPFDQKTLAGKVVPLVQVAAARSLDLVLADGAIADLVRVKATGAALDPVTVLRGLQVMPSTTNLCLQSSNFGTTWAAIGTPTRSAAADYCGDVALDLRKDADVPTRRRHARAAQARRAGAGAGRGAPRRAPRQTRGRGPASATSANCNMRIEVPPRGRSSG